MIQRFDAADFQRTILAGPEDRAGQVAAAHDYRLMLGTVMQAILDRYERRPDYPFLDTKLSLIDGTDFADDDPICGRGAVFTWIQGRGLEALAGHLGWLQRCPQVDEMLKASLLPRMRQVLAELVHHLETLRRRVGRLTFMMSPDGRPLRLADGGSIEPYDPPADLPTTLSDLFYVKGLAAAAAVLGDAELLARAVGWFETMIPDIVEGRQISDQQPLDPRNRAIGQVRGRHGLKMIPLGAATVMLDCTGNVKFQELGLHCIDDALSRHVNTDGDNALTRQWDMWEFVGDDGRPWVEAEGVLRGDPGHAVEFAGLALKFLRVCRERGTLAAADPERVTRYLQDLPQLLEQNFRTGFLPSGVGLVKQVDLVSRRVLHADVPWWSLPEALRAALGTCEVVLPEDCRRFAEIATRCSNAFFRYFIRPELHLLAFQTLDGEGRPRRSIPATPDADLGYHTGLSVIDALDSYARLESIR